MLKIRPQKPWYNLRQLALKYIEVPLHQQALTTVIIIIEINSNHLQTNISIVNLRIPII